VPVAPGPWAHADLVWVCVQGAFGALTVTMKLFPAIVTLHLLGGLVLLALLCVQAVRYAQAWRNGAVPLSAACAGCCGWLPRCGLQVALGGWVSTNYAVLACNDLPHLPGQLVADMDFRQGFTLWRRWA
jgi:cytochrome c oxidase assembly protein subunit 15